jgi:hypothetical protein
MGVWGRTSRETGTSRETAGLSATLPRISCWKSGEAPVEMTILFEDGILRFQGTWGTHRWFLWVFLLEGQGRGLPHLAKNERDVGHPDFGGRFREAVVWASPSLFRPTYALANVGHPSRG